MDSFLLKAMCSSVSGRYALALFNVALEHRTLERTLEEINIASKLLEKGQPFRIIILRIFQNRLKPEWLDDFLKKIDFLKTTSSFLFLTAHNKRIDCLPDIVRLFKMLVDDNLNQESILVYTSDEVNNEQKANIFEKLTNIFHKKINISFKIKESILGGLTAHSNSVTIDASVKHQIEKFAKIAKSYFD
ncbi:MAG: ATP synthase F1 subunit delta [Holosporales bacterium]|jgi:F-type H+-transporting ATPase subunit delta|nr:ATP synthase F1 subunit delta [Holosporales bacterium]